MNSQFLPPQQFGAPPNRASPPSFQTIPLGQQKPSAGDHIPAQFNSPANQPDQFPPLNPSGPPPKAPIPSSQLPPSSLGGDISHPFGLSSNKGDAAVHNGPPSFQNGPPQFHNGQAPGAEHSNNLPNNRTPQNFPQNQFGQPGNQTRPLPPMPGGPPTQFGSQLPNNPGQQASQKFNPPSFQPGQAGQAPQLNKPPSQGMQPPPPLGQPPSMTSGHFNQATQPGESHLTGRPPSHPSVPPVQHQIGLNQSNQFEHQPSLSQPQMGQPGPAVSNSGPFSPTGVQSNQFNPMQGPPKPGQYPSQVRSAHSQSLPGQPPLSGQPLQPMQPPLPGQPPLAMQPPLPGQPPQAMQPLLPGQQPQAMQPPLPGQPPQAMQPPLPGQPSQVMQPPLPGHPPMPGQPPLSKPPLPGQNPLQNVSGPYAPASFGGGSQMAPPYGPNQMANQMQGMHVSGQKQFPGPPRSGINGDTGPHMPPPLGQQPNTMNNQQLRGPPGPGYPPMPGQQPAMPQQGQYPNAAGQYPSANYQQPQQNRRLDPDQMPSPMQVIQDDQQNRAGVFVTNQKGLVPPLVTTNFVVQDQGNCSPRYIRSSMYNVPITQDIMKQTAVPFSLVISPMARQVDQEYPPPIVNFGTLGPVRCVRCKAYMCPFMQFVDSGRRFQCLFCMATTDVPTEYFQHLDHTGQRMDRYERPELLLGTYEFVATADYCRNNVLPKPPAIIFVIDVSYNNIKSGLVNLLCSQMKEIIQNLPVDQGQEKSNMKVGFITYNSCVHFYNIKGTLAAPQMLVVGDVHEMFMPLLDGFLSTPEESGPVIDLLMEQIPAMFAETRETETVLLPAIQAGLEALKASECVGKLVVFHSTLPSADAPGRLKNRDDRKLLGTDKEKTILTPQTQVYNQLGQDCVGAGCSVDLFILNNSYIDIATIGQVSRLTGGEVYKYTYFQADIDGERLVNDVIMDISRPIAFDGVMRVRTSTGVRPTDFYGHFYMSNTTDIELASIDCDKAVGVEIKHDDKLSEDTGVYIQTALLYTSCSGQRRLRIMNLSLKTCSQMADLYRSCDLDTIINYISKQACYKLLDNNPKAVKDSIINRAAQILAIYRKNCASPSSAGQLILPECMKLLPLYVNCLLKNDALSGGSDMTIDDRSFVLQAVMIMDVPTSVYYFYPRLIPLHDIDVTADPVSVPNPIRCTIDKINEQGVYILENGIHMFLWFGLGVNPDIIQKLFGAPSAIQVDIDKAHLPELDNPLSIAVRNVIDEIRIQRHRCMRLTIVRQREKLEPVFKHFLAEDRGTDGSASYVDFLCHMHKEIRNLLS